MEETSNLKSIVLSRQDFRENDTLVTFYSREKGKITLIARGAKKSTSKIAGHIEPLNFVDLMFVKGKQYNYVGSIKSIENFLDTKNSLEKLETSLKILTLYKNVIKEESIDEDVFTLLLDSLIFLNQVEKIDLEFFYNIFVIKFLVTMGYGINLDSCTECSKKIVPNNNYLNISGGGLYCPTCGSSKKNLTISDNSIKMLKLAINNNWTSIFNIKVGVITKEEFGAIVRSLKEYSFS